MATLTAGLGGGLVATIGMTVVMMAMGDGGPPPTAALVAKFAGGDPDDHAMAGMVLHLVYGIVAGGVFSVGAPLVGLGLEALAVATLLGAIYGLVLMVVGMAFWMRVVLGLEADRGTMATFVVAHVVYGVLLGVFVGSGLLG